MSGSAGWDYLVPTYHGSPWDVRRGALFSTDVEWPRVGVFCCPEGAAPWLVGSFSVSSAVLEERREIYWAWAREYVTGDGYVIPLGEQSGITGNTPLVGDDVHDPESLRQELASSFATHGPGSAEHGELIARWDAAQQSLRFKHTLKCGRCGRSHQVRSEVVQEVVTAFWRLGQREVLLERFWDAYLRVTRRAK